MADLGVPPWEERAEFFISAKIPQQVFSELAMSPPQGLRNRLSPFSFIGDRLPLYLAKAYERSMNARFVDQRWRYSIVLDDGTEYLRIIPHESGTEVNLHPIVSFVGTAIVAGVVGELA